MKSNLQAVFQVGGVILLFFVVMVVLRWILNCMIDVAVLRNSESLMRQLSQLRRWFCPWWHPRTQPQVVTEQEAPVAPSSQRALSERNRDMDQLLAGLTQRQKQKLLLSILTIQVVSEEDLEKWKQVEEFQHQAFIATSSDEEEVASSPMECRIINSPIVPSSSSHNNDMDPENNSPSRSSSQRTLSYSGGGGALLCPICIHDLEVGQNVISLASTCQHRFHSQCLVEWLCAHTRDCPYCRTEILTQEMLRHAYQRRRNFGV